MDMKKTIIIGAAVAIIAVLIISTSPQLNIGTLVAQPIGIVGYVTRANKSPCVGATVAIGDTSVITDVQGRYVTNGMAESGGMITARVSYHTFMGYDFSSTVTKVVDLSKPTQYLNITLGVLVADFTYSPSSPKPNDTVTFSDSSNGAIAISTWDFGDVVHFTPIATGNRVTHVYTAERTYTVIHTVTDDLGTIKSVSKTVTVKIPPPPPPPVHYYTLTVKTRQSNVLVTVCKALQFPILPSEDVCQPPKPTGNTENGSVAYAGLLNGTYTVSAGKEGYSFKKVTVTIAGNSEVYIDLTSQGQVSSFDIVPYFIIGGLAACIIIFIFIKKKKEE